MDIILAIIFVAFVYFILTSLSVNLWYVLIAAIVAWIVVLIFRDRRRI